VEKKNSKKGLRGKRRNNKGRRAGGGAGREEVGGRV